MQTKLPWLCAALLGFIGWLIGYSMNSGPSAPAPDSTTAAGLSSGGDSGATPAADPETAAMVKDFEQSATTIMEDVNYLRRSHRLYQMVEHLTAADMPGAMNAAMHLDQQKRAMLMNGLIAHWAELDPKAAVQYASALPKEQQTQWLRTNALAIWADKDFTGASQYALAMPPGKERNEALGGIATGLA